MNLLVDGLPDSVEVCGETVPIETDFRTGILFEEMIQDPTLSNLEKLRTALDLYFPDAAFVDAEAAQEALEKLFWFYRCGEDPPKEGAGAGSYTPPSFSYEYDAEYIYAAFFQAYRVDLAREALHWWQFRALFKALPEDTQIMKIIGYRTVKLPDKMPKDQRQFYERMKRQYALPESKDVQQLESDLSALLINGGNPAALLRGDSKPWQTAP